LTVRKFSFAETQFCSDLGKQGVDDAFAGFGRVC